MYKNVPKNKRFPMIVGNWKMNTSIETAIDLLEQLLDDLKTQPSHNIEVVVAPPFTALNAVVDFLYENSADGLIKVAAQDLFWEDSGAYTGAISGKMLRDAGAEYVIIGHSERRQYFYETDLTVSKKTQAALRNKLVPIVCVGETLAEREANKVEGVIARQIEEGLANIDIARLANVILAYEPVWAIGTGKTASPQQAEEVHAFIRKVLMQHFTPEISDKMRILYGGSVKRENSRELLTQTNIDGALVGGASLKAADFLGIIRNF